jgi:hypothetical protein
MTLHTTNFGPDKRKRLHLTTTAMLIGVTGAVLIFASGQPAEAQSALPGVPAVPQVRALLPDASQVPAGQAQPIDGVWLIREIGKRIAIKNGRAYAIDGWVHAFVFRIEPEQVVMKDIVEKQLGLYDCYDLPMLGDGTLTVQRDGTILAQIHSSFPAVYHFDPVQLSYPGAFRHELAAMQPPRRDLPVGSGTDRPMPPGAGAVANGPADPGYANPYPGNRQAVGQPPVEANPGYANPGYANPNPGNRQAVGQPPVEANPGYGNSGPVYSAPIAPPSANPGGQQGSIGMRTQPAPAEAQSTGGAMSNGQKAVMIGGGVVGGAAVYKLSNSVADTARTVGTAARAAKAAAGTAGNAARAAETESSFGRNLMMRGGDPEGFANVLKKGDAARAARGKAIGNEPALMNEIRERNPDAIDQLNKMGTNAQKARGAGKMERAARAAREAREAEKAAKAARTASRLAKAAKIVKGATGAGLAVAATGEVLKATTGMKVADPVDVGMEYAHALKGPHKVKNIEAVMHQRLEHHEANLQRVTKTFTTKGQLKKNLTAYGKSTSCKVNNLFHKKSDKKKC